MGEAPSVNYVDPGEQTNKSKLDALKADVDNALTTTGASFTWTEWPISVGEAINDADILELRSALDVAYDNLDIGCSTYHSTVYSATYSDYGDDSEDSHDSSDDSNNSVRSFNSGDFNLYD